MNGPGSNRRKEKPFLNRPYTRAGVPEGHRTDVAGGTAAFDLKWRGLALHEKDLDAGARAAILRSCRGPTSPASGEREQTCPDRGAKDRNRETSQFRAEVVECAGRCGIHEPGAVDRMNIPVIRPTGGRSMRRSGVA